MINNQELAAYLFLMENKMDPNAEIVTTDEYEFRAKALNNCLADFHNLSDELTLESEIYEIGKRHYGTDKVILRNFFKDVYLFLLQKSDGPRLAVLVSIFGLDNFKKKLSNRASHLWFY